MNDVVGISQRWYIVPARPERGFVEVKIYAKELKMLLKLPEINQIEPTIINEIFLFLNRLTSLCQIAVDDFEWPI